MFLNWSPFSRHRRGRATHRPEIAGPRHRRLKLEQLEDRRLLSITVDTLVDENNGIGAGAGTSLREAIAAATPGETIDFSITGTISLTSLGQLTINKSLTISGPGVNLLTITAYDPTPATKNGDGTRVINIDNSLALRSNVTISGMTLTGGDITGGGGAIRSLENLVLTDSTISDNSATSDGSLVAHGGGIYSRDGTLTVIRSTVTGNTSALSGGGIYNRNGQLSIRQGTISNNGSNSAAGWQGGGIYNGFANATISDSVITGNVVHGVNTGEGGGIFARDGSLSINSCSVTNNSAFAGGGIEHRNGRLDVVASTISGNSANSGGGVNFSGGGRVMLMDSSTISGNRTTFRGAAIGLGGNLGTTVIRHTMIHDNKANVSNFHDSTDGGGILIYDGTVGRIVLQNSIVAGNTSGGPSNMPVVNKTDITGPVDAFYTLIGVNSGAAITNRGGNLIGTSGSPIDALLGPLAANGGATLTHALLTGSPAINAGDPAAAAGIGTTPLYDQRGTPYHRVIGSSLDMGAFERQSPPGPTLPGDYNRGAKVDAADYVLWRKLLGRTLPPFDGADGTGNGSVGAEDFGVWTRHFGKPTGPTLPGDYNRGAKVDAADYVVWRKLLGTTVPAFDSADGSGDGTVGVEDFGVWTRHFDESLPTGGAGGDAVVSFVFASDSIAEPNADTVAPTMDVIETPSAFPSRAGVTGRASTLPSTAAERYVNVRDNALMSWLASQPGIGTYDSDVMDDWRESRTYPKRRPNSTIIFGRAWTSPFQRESGRFPFP